MQYNSWHKKYKFWLVSKMLNFWCWFGLPRKTDGGDKKAEQRSSPKFMLFKAKLNRHKNNMLKRRGYTPFLLII